MIECKLCEYKQDDDDWKVFSHHLSFLHGIKTIEQRKEYYDKYLRKDGDGNCKCCGNSTSFVNIKDGYKETCSLSCGAKMRKHYKLTDEQKKARLEKLEATSLAKYGTKNPSQNKEVRAKQKASLKKNYGVENPMESLEIRKIQTESILRNHGVKNPNDIPEVRQKHKDNYWKTENMEARKEGMKHVDWKEVNSRSLATKRQNGYDFSKPVAKTKSKIEAIYGSYRNLIIRNFENAGFYERRKVTLEKLGLTNVEIDPYNKTTKFTCPKCGMTTESSDSILIYTDRAYRGLTPCLHCLPYHSTESGEERQLKEYIASIYDGPITKLNRSNCDGKYEYDIYLEDLKIAFEYNGLYYHSLEMKNNDKDYHLKKTLYGNEHGFRVVHIFSDDWIHKSDIVKSRIASMLGLSEYRIFARKCKLEHLVDSSVVNSFMIENHIQGACSFSQAYGLYYEETLVAVMTFGRSRFNSSDIELLRYCSIKGTNVVGGASKLFKYYLANNPDVKKVISYSDIAWNTGTLYTNLGFRLVSCSKPSYSYVKSNGDGIRENRMKFQKDKLVKAGADPNKTEYEIMKDLGYFQVYNCGMMKFVYER